MNNSAHILLKKYTLNIASQVGMKVDKIKIINGETFGCLDVHLINIISKGIIVNVLSYHSDLDDLIAGRNCDSLEMKLRWSLFNLNNLVNNTELYSGFSI
jgi:hypothetical protein